LKKGEIFSADIHPVLWSEKRFCRLLKNCSFEVNYLVLWRSADFTRSSFPKNMCRTCVNILVLDLRLLWFYLIWTYINLCLPHKQLIWHFIIPYKYIYIFQL
jgi:hypothetical protein